MPSADPAGVCLFPFGGPFSGAPPFLPAPGAREEGLWLSACDSKGEGGRRGVEELERRDEMSRGAGGEANEQQRREQGSEQLWMPPYGYCTAPKQQQAPSPPQVANLLRSNSRPEIEQPVLLWRRGRGRVIIVEVRHITWSALSRRLKLWMGPDAVSSTASPLFPLRPTLVLMLLLSEKGGGAPGKAWLGSCSEACAHSNTSSNRNSRAQCWLLLKRNATHLLGFSAQWECHFPPRTQLTWPLQQKWMRA